MRKSSISIPRYEKRPAPFSLLINPDFLQHFTVPLKRVKMPLKLFQLVFNNKDDLFYEVTICPLWTNKKNNLSTRKI